MTFIPADMILYLSLFGLNCQGFTTTGEAWNSKVPLLYMHPSPSLGTGTIDRCEATVSRDSVSSHPKH